MTSTKTPLAPINKTQVLRGRRGMETWEAETTDGTWIMGRQEDIGTTWTVAHKPTGIVVAEFLTTLTECRAYIASGEAGDDLATEQAKQEAARPAEDPATDEESFWDVTPKDWGRMKRSQFDAAIPLTLFDMTAIDNSARLRKPDRCGTPDLFSDVA